MVEICCLFAAPCYCCVCWSCTFAALSNYPKMKHLIPVCLLALIGAGCSKTVDPPADHFIHQTTKPQTSAEPVLYTIKKGEHFSDKAILKKVELASLVFSVRFDSTAIYRSKLPVNQYDINKLLGFADNNSHHQQYSARIGWRWSGGALRLFGYVYNKGIRQEKEIGVVPIGSFIACSISVLEQQYLFTVNEKKISMPRESTTSKATGYLLYPYFGGDEVAPHNITISIIYR